MSFDLPLLIWICVDVCKNWYSTSWYKQVFWSQDGFVKKKKHYDYEIDKSMHVAMNTKYCFRHPCGNQFDIPAINLGWKQKGKDNLQKTISHRSFSKKASGSVWAPLYFKSILQHTIPYLYFH